MPAQDMLKQIGETIGSNATVKSVFGEPICAGGRTVVPVAQLSCVFGGGLGSGHGPEAIASAGNMRGEGEGGGGGAVRAYPAGALEITESGIRFVPFQRARVLAAVGLGAFVAGLMMVRLIRRRR